MPNDRSDAALRERLDLAEKATKGPWKTDEVVTRKKDFEPSYVVKDKDGFTIVDVLPVSAYQATAAHIAANSPDVVKATSRKSCTFVLKTSVLTRKPTGWPRRSESK